MTVRVGDSETDDTPIRVLCLPYAGGGASFFKAWRRSERSAVDFIGVQLPGRENLVRLPLARSVAEAVDAVLPWCEEQLALPGPVCLFGHSSGAVLAFELARRIDVLAPGRVSRLFVSGSAAPWLGRPGKVTGLPDEEFVTAVQSNAGAAHPALAEPRLRSLVLPPLRADVQMHEEYEAPFGTTTEVPITAIRGAQDALISGTAAKEWAHATRADFDYVEVPGEHMYVMGARNTLIDLVSSYRNVIDRTQRSEVRETIRAGQGAGATVRMPDSIPEVFANVASAAGDRVAITGGGAGLTYAALDDASRTAASSLVARGVQPGERVGVCMERTPDAVVAFLGVLRAGACYVPLDPTHPPARRAYMAADADLTLVITNVPEIELPSTVGVITVEDLLGAPATQPLPVVEGDAPAYVIYTSGTTGQPKGTVIPHRNVLALVAATRSVLRYTEADVWTVFHSFAFDFSVWEIWGCLLSGARLVMVPYWTSRTPAAFVQLLRDERVTVLSQTPSAFVNLIPAVLARDETLALRMVVFGGEALRLPTLVPWISRVPLTACRLVNMYGITETTVHVTFHDVTAEDLAANSRSVGRPLPGWSVSVRDGDGRILPFGEAGEICVGGAGVATGYLGLPELTEARFPIDPSAGTRYYRSGDLGRLSADGTLEHLGRIDDQVKIRGYRVELGEIRATLLSHPAIRDAVVAFHDDDTGGEIRAYLVAAEEVRTTDLRRWLRKALPDYMIPARVRTVAALPLTPNGKADLAALAALDAAGELGDQSAPVIEAAAPVSPEEAVLRIWSGEFGRDGARHDFFDLGGTSLQALKIASALTDLGGQVVVPRDIYLHPTVEELSKFMIGR
ncbi:amino acid adenylation domain-containing protein [Actinoplanes sp. NPDC020271]|uniref:amino acid adenylation domain-containing protein n=1 Tax=Actinoplanes sp. NPDC020271 TaxID=3363896 RepID=UPI0037A515BA